MRYYDISVSDSSSGKNVVQYTSHPNGPNAPPDPGALNVELDLTVGPWSAPAGDNTPSWIRIWGIPLTQIAQAVNFNPDSSGAQKALILKGGMGKGYPLADPAKSGLLLQGGVVAALGNWIGTNMTLDLFPGALPPSVFANIGKGFQVSNFSWDSPAKTKMADAIKKTLQQVYPNFKININISDSLILQVDDKGYYINQHDFAEHVQALSQKIMLANYDLGPWATAEDVKSTSYPGVRIFTKSNTVYVTDNSQQSGNGTGSAGVKQIDFNDLIGQVTWIAPLEIQITCVMRADLMTGDEIKLPQGQIATSQQAMGAFARERYGSIFQGTFIIKHLRHVGNYKSPDAQAWVTIINAFPNTLPGGQQSASAQEHSF